MSLLLQALQKAAKSREGDADSVPAATTDLALEPASPGSMLYWSGRLPPIAASGIESAVEWSGNVPSA